jgi:hypothetical protein
MTSPECEAQHCTEPVFFAVYLRQRISQRGLISAENIVSFCRKKKLSPVILSLRKKRVQVQCFVDFMIALAPPDKCNSAKPRKPATYRKCPCLSGYKFSDQLLKQVIKIVKFNTFFY